MDFKVRRRSCEILVSRKKKGFCAKPILQDGFRAKTFLFPTYQDLTAPPAYLKVHTASYHFLGNGKIRRFGCSLLFSGVASITHMGYSRPCEDFKVLGRLVRNQVSRCLCRHRGHNAAGKEVITSAGAVDVGQEWSHLSQSW